MGARLWRPWPFSSRRSREVPKGARRTSRSWVATGGPMRRTCRRAAGVRTGGAAAWPPVALAAAAAAADAATALLLRLRLGLVTPSRATRRAALVGRADAVGWPGCEELSGAAGGGGLAPPPPANGTALAGGAGGRGPRCNRRILSTCVVRVPPQREDAMNTNRHVRHAGSEHASGARSAANHANGRGRGRAEDLHDVRTTVAALKGSRFKLCRHRSGRAHWAQARVVCHGGERVPSSIMLHGVRSALPCMLTRRAKALGGNVAGAAVRPHGTSLTVSSSSHPSCRSRSSLQDRRRPPSGLAAASTCCSAKASRQSRAGRPSSSPSAAVPELPSMVDVDL